MNQAPPKFPEKVPGSGVGELGPDEPVGWEGLADRTRQTIEPAIPSTHRPSIKQTLALNLMVWLGLWASALRKPPH